MFTYFYPQFTQPNDATTTHYKNTFTRFALSTPDLGQSWKNSEILYKIHPSVVQYFVSINQLFFFVVDFYYSSELTRLVIEHKRRTSLKRRDVGLVRMVVRLLTTLEIQININYREKDNSKYLNKLRTLQYKNASMIFYKTVFQYVIGKKPQ